MLWSFVQLNKAFSSREAVHIQLARMDQRVPSGLRTRESGLVCVCGGDGRVEKGWGWKVVPPLEPGGKCWVVVTVSGSYICPQVL